MYSSQGEAVAEWLEAYRKEEEELDELIYRIRELRGSATSIKAQEITNMPKSPNVGDPLSEYVVRLEALEGAMERRLYAHERDREALVGLIRKIRKPEEKDVVSCRYLYGMGWGDIKYKLYGGAPGFAKKPESYERRMYRAHNRAIEWMGRFWDIK